MSLTLAGRSAAEAQAGARDQGNPGKQFTDAVVGYIPAETLAASLALFGVVESSTGRWAIFWALLAVSPVWVLYHYARNVRGKPQFRKWPWLKMAEASVAFFGWFCTIPGNPIASAKNGVIIVVSVGAGLAVLQAVMWLVRKLATGEPEDPAV